MSRSAGFRPTKGRRRRGAEGPIAIAVIGASELPSQLRLASEGRRAVFSIEMLGFGDLGRLAPLPVRGVLVDGDLGDEAEVVSVIQVCRALRPDLPVIVLTGAPGRGRRLTDAGAVFSLHKDGITCGAVRSIIRGAGDDVARSRHEQARNEQMFAAAHELSSDVIVSVTTDGRVVHCNRATTELLGIAREQLLGRALVDVIPHTKQRDELVEAVTSGTALSEVQTVWSAAEGRLASMSLTVAPLRATSDIVIGAVVVGRDISEAKRSEELERLASIGQLAAGVAHELNNPAAYVRGNVELLREGLDQLRADLSVADAPARRATTARLDDMTRLVSECLLGVDRIAAVVKDLSVFSRLEHDDVAISSINDLVHNACAIASNELRHRAEVDLQLADVPAIALDRAKVAQVFLNLLVNAAHAVGDGAREHNVVRVTSRVVGDEVCVTVEDNGHGIDPEHVDRIFAPFFTTKPRGSGTGLGLAISLETVRRHGGDIGVRTQLGEGTKFEVRFPLRTRLHRPEFDRVVAEPSPAPVGDTARRRVLLVDDEPLVRRAFARMLSRSHDVTQAEGGAAAMQLIESGQEFDVILCDLMMPEIDGVALWHLIEARDPTLLKRIVFVSGGAVTPHVRTFVGVERPVIMEKPVERSALMNAVARTAAAADVAAAARTEVGSPSAVCAA